MRSCVCTVVSDGCVVKHTLGSCGQAGCLFCKYACMLQRPLTAGCALLLSCCYQGQMLQVVHSIRNLLQLVAGHEFDLRGMPACSFK